MPNSPGRKSRYRLRNNDLDSFGLPKGATLTVLHMSQVPYGAIGCVEYNKEPLIGQLHLGQCGCAYLKTARRTLKLAKGAFKIIGLVVEKE